MYQLIERFYPFSPLSRMALAFLTTLLIVLFFGKSFIQLLAKLRIAQPIREGKHYEKFALLHQKKKNTPMMGGVLFLGATLISMVFWADWSSLFVRLVTPTLLFFMALGASDDWAKLRSKTSSGLLAKSRFLLESGWSLLLILFMLYPDFFSCFGCPQISFEGHSVSWDEWRRTMVFPFFGNVMMGSIGGLIFLRIIEWLCLVGAPNAVNLSDGLDGLAAGLAIPATIALACVAYFSNDLGFTSRYGLFYIESSQEIGVILSALLGGVLGFLWFNCHPAEIFMGDTGSLGIGAILGTCAFLLNQEWFLGVVAIVFVVETLSVILQVASFKLRKKRIFLCSPLHHHFEYGGLPEMKVVTRFWIVGFLAAILGVYLFL